MALEMVDVVVGVGYLLVLFGGAALGGFLANIFYGFYGFSSVSRRVLSLENGIRGRKAVEVKADKEGRQAIALGEAAAMMKEGKLPIDVLKELGPKYPDVAMELFKKASKGDLGAGLEELLE